MNMFKSFGDTAPSIYFLLWKFINIVCNFFMGNKHQVKLQGPTAIAFLGKVLKHLGVAQGRFGDIRFKVLAELIINYIDPGVALVTKLFGDAFVKLNHIEAEKWIENASCG